MAEVTISLKKLPGKEDLPPICARCGRAASGTRRLRLRVYEPFRGPTLWNTLFGASRTDQRAVHEIEQLFDPGKGTVELPVCWWHRWIFPASVAVKAITEMEATLSNLSPQFTAALIQRGLGYSRPLQG